MSHGDGTDKREVRTLPIEIEEVRESVGDGKRHAVRGTAIVFGRRSLDLGGFFERIHKDALDVVLDRHPEVFLRYDHDDVLASTTSAKAPLEITKHARGVGFFARLTRTPKADEVVTLMEDDLVKQASFAFVPGKEEWKVIENDDGTEEYERTILEVAELFDLTITAQGAYPQTKSELARSYRSQAEAAVERGDLPERALEALAATREVSDAAPAPDPADVSAPQPDGLDEDEEAQRIAQDLADRDARRQAMKERKAQYRAELVTAKRRQLDLERG